MSFDRLPFNVFDFALVAFLVLGLIRGRKHGMSQELFFLIKWVTLVVVCTMLYEPLGRGLSQSSPFSLLTCYLMVYLGLGLLVFGAFALVKHRLGGKLVGSDVFGRSEYYLGMGSGLVRFCCILIAALALLNARYYSAAEVKAQVDFQNDMYGSTYFPGLAAAQSTVFQKSLFGPWIHENLSFLLIKPTVPEDKRITQRDYVFP